VGILPTLVLMLVVVVVQYVCVGTVMVIVGAVFVDFTPREG
jgi:hypothetical protein